MTYNESTSTISVFNVRNSGALGNGVHDDTAAIQAAVTSALNTANGGVIYIPTGTYKLTSQITVSDTSTQGIRIYGDGYSTILNFVGPANGIVANTTNNIEVDHLHFTGSLQFGVFMGFGSMCWIHDNLFDNCITQVPGSGPLAGVLLEQVNDAWIFRNRFIGNGIQSATLDQGQVISSGTNPPIVTLSGIPVSTVTGPRIEITTGGAGTAAVFRYSLDGGTTFTSGVSVAASVPLGASGLTANFTVSGSDTYSTNNVYQGSAITTGTNPPAVWLSGTPTGVTGAIIIQVTTTGTQSGGNGRFQWSHDNGVTWTTGVTIAATVVLGSTGMTAHFTSGTYFDNTEGNTPDTYTAPYFAAYAGYAISQYFGSTASRIHVTDNYIENTWLPYGILLYGVDHSEVVNNTINMTGSLNRESHSVASSGYGIALYSFSPVYHNRVENNTIDNSAGMGIYLQSCYDSAVVGNVLTNVANNAIAASLNQGAITTNVGSVAITGNVIKGSGIYGITIEGNYCSVVGNRVDSCVSASVYVDNLTTMSYFTIQGNQISNGSAGIYAPLGCSNGTIVGNTFFNMSQPAIYLLGASDMVISENQFDTITASQYGIYLDAASTSCVVNGNSFSNTSTFCIANSSTHSSFRGNVADSTCALGIISNGNYCTVADNDFSQVSEDQYLVTGTGSILRSTTATLDARDYGVDLAGVSDATPGLTAAYTEALASNAGYLNFADGYYNIANSINFPAGLTYKFARGAVFTIASGKLVTFFDKIEADPSSHIFTGLGAVSFASKSQPFFWNDWTGLAASMTVSANSAATGSNSSGENLLLTSGSKDGSGSPGYVDLQVATNSRLRVLDSSTATNITLTGTGQTYTILQASESTAIQGANLTIQPQQSTHATDQGGGNVVVALQTPTNAGTEALLEVTRGGVFNAGIGPYVSGGASFGAVYLGPGLTPSNVNFTILNNATGNSAYLNTVSGGNIRLSINASGGLLMSTSTTHASAWYPAEDITTSLGNSGGRWTNAFIQGEISGGTNAGATGGNLTIAPEIGTSSGGNVLGGNLIVALQTPTGTGLSTESFLQATRGGSTVFSAGGMPGSPGYAGIWGTNTPTGNNYIVQTNGTYLWLNSPSSGGSVFIGGGNATWLTTTSSELNPATDLTLSLGDSTHRWTTIYGKLGLTGGTNSGTTGNNFTITPEVGTPVSSVVTGGSLVVALQTQGSLGGSAASLQISSGGTNVFATGPYPAAPTSGILWLGSDAVGRSTGAYAMAYGGGGNGLNIGVAAASINMAAATQPLANITYTLGSTGFQWLSTYTRNFWLNNTVFQDGYSSATTVNSSTTTIYTDTAIPSNTVYDFVVTVVGVNTAYPSPPDVYRADFSFTYVNRSGSLTAVGATATALNVRTLGAGNTWGGASISTSGTSIIVQVAGLASTTIDWSVSFNRQQVA